MYDLFDSGCSWEFIGIALSAAFAFHFTRKAQHCFIFLLGNFECTICVCSKHVRIFKILFNVGEKKTSWFHWQLRSQCARCTIAVLMEIKRILRALKNEIYYVKIILQSCVCYICICFNAAVHSHHENECYVWSWGFIISHCNIDFK